MYVRTKMYERNCREYAFLLTRRYYRRTIIFYQNWQKHHKWPNKLILIFSKNLKRVPSVVFNEESKTSLGFEIGHRQQNIWCKPSPQLLAYPAVRPNIILALGSILHNCVHQQHHSYLIILSSMGGYVLTGKLPVPLRNYHQWRCQGEPPLENCGRIWQIIWKDE